MVHLPNQHHPDFFAPFCRVAGLFRSVALCKAPAMSNSIIVWDLETVPDLRGYAAANGMSASTDDEVREAIGDKFPKRIYRHKNANEING